MESIPNFIHQLYKTMVFHHSIAIDPPRCQSPLVRSAPTTARCTSAAARGTKPPLRPAARRRTKLQGRVPQCHSAPIDLSCSAADPYWDKYIYISIYTHIYIITICKYHILRLRYMIWNCVFKSVYVYIYLCICVCVTNSLCIHTHAHKIWTNYVGDPTEVMEPRGNHPRSN